MTLTGRDEARAAVITYCHRMQAEHLICATAGNISTRVPDEPGLIAMTPTSMAYDSLEPEDICLVSVDGDLVDGHRQPTSELPLHTLVYARRPEVGAVIHTHSVAAMTMGVLGWDLPPILSGLIEAAGGDVRVAPYSSPGTTAVADDTTTALADRGACFMPHHGLLSVGVDLARAFLAASVTESAARVYLDARAQRVEVPELPADEVARIARSWRRQWATVAAAHGTD